jgi:hypothetical protein
MESAPTSPSRIPVDQPILESLVIPLAMVVIDEFLEGASKVALAEGHHPIEALELWRADASITAGVYITERRWRLGLRPSSCGTLRGRDRLKFYPYAHVRIRAIVNRQPAQVTLRCDFSGNLFLVADRRARQL